VSVPKARVVRIQRVDRNSLRSPSLPSTSGVIAVDVSSQHRIPRVVHWCLLLYVFSIPLEPASLGFTSQYLSFSKMMGLQFFATYFFYYNPLLTSWPSPSRACWWFLAYMAIFSLHGFFIPEHSVLSFVLRLFTMLQLIMFFWVAGDLCKDERVLRQVLLMYAIASSILAVGLVLRLPAFAPTFDGPGDEMGRGSVLGYNSNALSTIWTLAIVSLVGLCLHPAYMLITKLLWVFLAFINLIANVYAGSRSGLGSLLIGFLVYLAPHWRAQWKLRTILLALLGLSVTIYFAMHSPLIMQRWQQTVDEGQLAGRENIVPAALQMFLERPLLGWHPVIFGYELGQRLGVTSKDPHNLFLHLLLEVGIVGTVPFLMGLWGCAQMAWQARAGPLGLLPLSLLITLLAATMSHTDLALKCFWLVLACAAGSLAAGHATRPRMLLIRRSLGNEA
jgi:O-antigen ligase